MSQSTWFTPRPFTSEHSFVARLNEYQGINKCQRMTKLTACDKRPACHLVLCRRDNPVEQDSGGLDLNFSFFFLGSQSPFRGHSACWQTVKRAPSRCARATRSSRTFNRGEQRGTMAARVFRINSPCLFSQRLPCSWSFSRLYFRCASAASPDLTEVGGRQGKFICSLFSSHFKTNKHYTK